MKKIKPGTVCIYNNQQIVCLDDSWGVITYRYLDSFNEFYRMGKSFFLSDASITNIPYSPVRILNNRDLEGEYKRAHSLNMKAVRAAALEIIVPLIVAAAVIALAAGLIFLAHSLLIHYNILK